MNLQKFIFFIVIIIVCVACDDTLPPDYMIDDTKVIAVKIIDPEVQAGSAFTMQMFIGGRLVNQNMTNTVSWFYDPENPDIAVFTAPYNETFEFLDTYWDYLPEDIFPESYHTQGWFDFPITARININGKYFNAKKTVRIVKSNPQQKNPEVTGITLKYKVNGIIKEVAITNFGQSVSIPHSEVPNYLAMVSTTKDLLPGANEKLVYRWQTTVSKASGEGRLYFRLEKDVVEDILGQGQEASENQPSAVLSFVGENDEMRLQYGVYDVYLVVRDKANNALTPAEDRLGLDFFYFTLRAGDL